mgnify:CR=1 FL=1
MESYFLMWLLILFVGTIVGYIIVKNVLKTVVTFLFIIFLFATITIILTYSDIQEVKQELGEKEIIVLIHENQALLFGDVEKSLWSDENETEHQEITIEQNVLENYVALKRYNAILEQGEFYKVVAINISFYDPLNEEIETSTGVKTKTELLALLQNSAYTFEDRAEAVETLNQEIMDQEGMRYIIEQYKEGSIVIYPKTMVFRILEIIPTEWFTEEETENEEE